MAPAGHQQPTSEARTAPRTNMFIGAVLQGADFSAPVRIRNLSVAGALVEGAALPEVSTLVRLVRGGLAVPAQVVWSDEGRCGLRLLSTVLVSDWLASPAHHEQQRIDGVVHLAKAGATQFPVGGPRPDLPRPSQLAHDLRTVGRLVETLSDALADDDELVSRHGRVLQNLDVVVQTISAVADFLSGGPDQSATASRLANVRASYTQALGQR